jgi:YD repeat-containing protein
MMDTGEVLETYTYKNGVLDTITNQYGDVTYCDEYGRRSYTVHTTQDYDENGKPVPGTQKAEVVERYYYDENGRLIKVEHKLPGGKWGTTKYIYDGAKLVRTEEYDADGNKIGYTTYEDGKPMETYSIDKNGQAHLVAKNVYSSNGSLEKTITYDVASGKENGYIEYDKYGRQTKVHQVIEGTDIVVLENVYKGAKIEKTINYLDNTVTYYDEWGNKWYDEYQKRHDYDPWTAGTLTIIRDANGKEHLALLVDPKEVGNDFYSMNPELVAGKTQTTQDGKLIFMINCDDKNTENELKQLVGHKVNIMWQYYSKAASEGSGFVWLHLASTSDWRVAYHLQNDDANAVTRGMTSWDRTRQFVVLD